MSDLFLKDQRADYLVVTYATVHGTFVTEVTANGIYLSGHLTTTDRTAREVHREQLERIEEKAKFHRAISGGVDQ